MSEKCDEGGGTPVDPPNFRCRRDGEGGFWASPSDGTVDPERWDAGGELSPMPLGKWQMQLIFSFKHSKRIVYGQTVFNPVEDVRAAVLAKDLPVYDPGMAGSDWSVLAVKQGATDLMDPAQALILESHCSGIYPDTLMISKTAVFPDGWMPWANFRNGKTE